MGADHHLVPGELIAALIVGSVGFAAATVLSLADGSSTALLLSYACMSLALLLGCLAALVIRQLA